MLAGHTNFSSWPPSVYSLPVMLALVRPTAASLPVRTFQACPPDPRLPPDKAAPAEAADPLVLHQMAFPILSLAS